MTGSDDFSQLHDEPSRQLRVFPPPGDSDSRFSLYEDDGRTLGYRSGEYAEVGLRMRTTPDEIVISAHVTGSWALPYRSIDVVLPAGEGRRLSLDGRGVELVRAR